MQNLDDEDIEIIMTLARELTGTKVNSSQHGIIVQNVGLRISVTKSGNLENYLALVNDSPEEFSYLMSAVTIHTTSWFREPGAFTVLEKMVLERLRKDTGPVQFNLLSAACSTGEEVYSLAATLETIKRAHPRLTIK